MRSNDSVLIPDCNGTLFIIKSIESLGMHDLQ